MTDSTSRTVREIGRDLAKGALWDFLFPLLAFWFVLALPLAWAADKWGDRDSTDSPSHRSGMRPRTDYGTGCQYLETSKGHLTPRMGADGRQICTKGAL